MSHAAKAPLLCSVCGELPIRRRQGKYCVNCGPKGLNTVLLVCVICKTTFRKRYKRNARKTCGDLCNQKLRSENQLGSRSHRWRGGLTEKNALARKGVEVKQWRAAVFARDQFTCVECGVRGGRLHADHIKPWSLYPALRFDISNGRTLCKPCHLRTDTWGWKAIYRSQHARCS